MNKLIGCFQGMNESEMIPYSLGSVYGVLDTIYFVEGAVEGWFDTPHSTDDTIEVVKSIDVDHKVEIIQKDGYWTSLEEMKDQFTQRIEVGDILVINDCDEIYNPEDLLAAGKILMARPQYNELIPIFHEFFGDFRHILRPIPGVVNLSNQRYLRMLPGMTYKHHHPTASVPVQGQYRDTSIDSIFEDQRLVVPDFNIYHLSYVKSREYLIEKHRRYYETFDKNPPPIALERAEKQYEDMKGKVMHYDGPVPKVLEKHPLYGKDVVGGNWPHWKTALEYRKPELIESPYNIKWTPPPKASVVITCYNNPQVLEVTLPYWKRVCYNDLEVVVVDDGSSPEEASKIKELVEGAGWKYLYNDSGDKYCIASARNLGIWNTTGKRVIFTDSDMIPCEDFVLEHMTEGNSNTIVVGPRHHIPEGSDWYLHHNINNLPIMYGKDMKEDSYPSAPPEWRAGYVPYGLDGQRQEALDPDTLYIQVGASGGILAYAIGLDRRLGRGFRQIEEGRCLDPWEHTWGANFSVDRAQLISINGFDEEFDGNWGAEDTDLAFRLITKGLVVKPVRNAIGYHIDHPTRQTTGQREKLNKKMQEPIIRTNPRSWVD